jgi:hypothetical protein
VKVSADVGSSGDWLRIGCATYCEWVSSPEGQLATWKSALCAAEKAVIVLRGNESSAIVTVFSVAEFARLCMLLTQDEEVRCALIASGKNLSRTERDAGARRDGFWSTTVAPRYNEGSLNISEILFISSLEAVVKTKGESEPRPSSATPIPRTGGELKEIFLSSASAVLRMPPPLVCIGTDGSGIIRKISSS